jgi:copper chaperone CopZ
MKTLTFEVENIKCGGCMKSISDTLLKIQGVEQVVDINKENQTILVNTTNDEGLAETIYTALKQMGYPKKGESTWIDKSKSVVSCAIGKIS